MKYVTDDGYSFNTIEDAEKHEEEIKKEKVKKQKLLEEKNKREEELVKAWNNFEKLRNKFYDDYGSVDISIPNRPRLFSDILNDWLL